MELFYDNGHISNEGFAALAAGTLDDMQSLETAEHLSFCDSCLMEFSEFVEKGHMLRPEKPLKGKIMKRVKRQGLAVVFRKYATVAAAACMAIVMWNTVNGAAFLKPARHDDASFFDSARQFFSSFDESGQKISNGINNFFDSFIPKASQDSTFVANTGNSAKEEIGKKDNDKSNSFFDNLTGKNKEDNEAAANEAQQASTGESEKIKTIEEKEKKFITPEQREAEFDKSIVSKLNPDDKNSH